MKKDHGYGRWWHLEDSIAAAKWKFPIVPNGLFFALSGRQGEKLSVIFPGWPFIL
jgi:hypothetical protein